MAGGRPTKYTPELVEKARQWVDDYKQSPEHPIPMICTLALHLGIRRETIHVWVKDDDKEEFSNIVGELMEKQEQLLFYGGLLNKFNASITKLGLVKHGHTDRIDSNIKVNDWEDKSDKELADFVRKNAHLLDDADSEKS